jgi:hypothetical protein
MALDASQVLGSPQLAGVKVNPRGAARSRVAGSAGFGVGGILGGVIGATAGTRAERRQAQIASETPKFGRVGYLAVTEHELALIKLKSSLVTFELDEVIARVPRSDVASAELGRGLASSLTITFGNRDSWQLEVPRPQKKQAQAVVHALGG